MTKCLREFMNLISALNRLLSVRKKGLCLH